jgi:hypothetical protein
MPVPVLSMTALACYISGRNQVIFCLDVLPLSGGHLARHVRRAPHPALRRDPNDGRVQGVKSRSVVPLHARSSALEYRRAVGACAWARRTLACRSNTHRRRDERRAVGKARRRAAGSGSTCSESLHARHARCAARNHVTRASCSLCRGGSRLARLAVGPGQGV